VPAAAVFGRTHQHLFFSIHLEHPQAIVARDLTKCRCVNIFVYAFRVKIYAISWTTIAALISIADRDILVSVEIEVVKIYCTLLIVKKGNIRLRLTLVPKPDLGVRKPNHLKRF